MRRKLWSTWLVGAGLAAASLPAQITETPDTVAPGRFLLEMDALTLTVNKDAGSKYTAFGAATTFVSTGLTANLDLQVGAELFLSQKFDAGGLSERHSGIGDIYIRTKWRFYEAADTYTSAAVLPYIKIPTNSGGVGNDSMEGGLIVPFQTQLVGGFSLMAMGQVDILRNDRNDGYDSRWLAAMAVHRQVTKAIGFYGELTAAKATGGRPWDGLLGGGVTLSMSDDVWWDYAMYTGISSGSADWSSALRLNWRF
ncbi:MAG: transporter [Opitutae bacterium]